MKHATNQIAIFESEKQKLEQQSIKQQQQPPPLMQDLSQSSQQMIPSLLNSVTMIMSQQQNRNEASMIQSMLSSQNFQIQQAPLQQQQVRHQLQQDKNNQFQNFNLPPPNFSIPDLSRPPPGLRPLVFKNSSSESSPRPSETFEEPEPQPYFSLPAGLMVPLIGIEQSKYHSIDPNEIKLPLATTPTEKCLKSVEAFYSAPSHERPRDTEGWEKLGLYEYFKTKNSFKKTKDEAIARGGRARSKSPSPIPITMTRPVKRQKKRIYSSKSPEIRASNSKSRSASPEVRSTITITPTTSRHRNRKRSRSPSPSHVPYRNFNRDNRMDRRKRSVTPPSFMGAAPRAATEFIDEGNKGHQMLKKLGWTSGGLGTAKNQGITEPISGGEFRDRNDIYKVSGNPTQKLQYVSIFIAVYSGRWNEHK